MVDRYTLKCSAEDISNEFNIPFPDHLPRYNAAPTQLLPVITQQSPQKILYYQWGIISGLSNKRKLSPKLFNLPIESAFIKSSYRNSLLGRRCLIFIDGFYLWKNIGKNKQTPYYITLASRKPFLVGGIWEESDEFNENVSNTFMLLTKNSTPSLSNYQEDMPLIFSKELSDIWISQNSDIHELEGLCVNNSDLDFIIHPVSPLIANIEVDKIELINPSIPSDQYGNYTLFG